MDPGLEIGKLITAVDILVKEVTILRHQMDYVTAQANTGKGLFYGAVLAAGGAGAGISTLIDKLFS